MHENQSKKNMLHNGLDAVFFSKNCKSKQKTAPIFLRAQ